MSTSSNDLPIDFQISYSERHTHFIVNLLSDLLDKLDYSTVTNIQRDRAALFSVINGSDIFIMDLKNKGMSSVDLSIALHKHDLTIIKKILLKLFTLIFVLIVINLLLPLL